MGALMRAYDWSTTTLGPKERWPQSLVTLVRVMLNSQQPMFIAWGPDRTLVYNDTYAPMLGGRHPSALGRPFFEIWPEVRDAVGALMDRVFTGDPVHMDDLQLTLHRNGYPEETHFAFSYTPVFGDDGAVAGLFCACTETTRQVLAERQAASERQRQRVMLQQMPGFVAVLRDPPHIFEYVNDAYVTIAGQRDYLGRSAREVFPEVEGKGFFELLDRVYKTGEAYTASNQPIRFAGDDADRFITFIYQPIRDAAGAVTGIFVGGYEMTDQVRARAALAESESRYRALFESIDVGFCIIELRFEGDRAVDYRIVEANPAFERQTGANVLGLWVSEFAPDLEHHWFETYGHVALTGEPAHFENKADVFGRWFDVRALRVGDPGEHRVAVLFSDISERKRMEDALRVMNTTLERQVSERTAERNFLATIVERTDVLVMAADLNYTILAINKANADEFERIYGVRPKVGDNMLDLLADQPEHQAQVRAGWGRGLAGEETTFVEDYGDPERTRPYYEIKFRTLRDERGERVGCYQFVADVTERLRGQAELAQAQEALRQSQKMEAVGQLTGGLAHDFNNLLAGISGSLELMQTRMQQGRLTDVDRYMTAAQGAAKRAAALTHRLLAFSRRQTLDPKPTDVTRLATGMHDLIQRTVGPGIPVEVVGATNGWPALVDPPQLENALLNLCINARDAMPDGGTITVETANKWMDERAARQHDLPEGQYLSLCVTDTGTGMPPEVVARAFDPFFTTKPIGEGTGLGLSMIYGFAQQSGGQVRIYSEVGQGTTVCIYLPRHYGEVEDETRDQTIGELPRSEAGETVLIVDDEPTVRMLITDILEDLGYAAIEAGDSATGLKVLQSDVRIDLLVTDVGLPGGMNGRQMADAARVHRPELKVLFITGYAENAILGNGTLPPGMAVLTKPFAMDRMAARIRSMIEGSKEQALRS
ncbi:PAS domain-containing protein [Methylobacterium sp. J-088]|uniref:PAS domain-containing protein n=1 Tax=Methylobacterium sp. J-088 TaxID=2836664 RepID=UPI001FBBE629|nr:PAS domain-containing protein [Methylobacterium sp. J-088]MCJ2061741.1 PAS domain-containing protein [Methylobacterium sp. J-088]